MSKTVYIAYSVLCTHVRITTVGAVVLLVVVVTHQDCPYYSHIVERERV